MTVDAVYAESVEHVKRSHPFGVTFCQVVVHGYYVYAVSGQCIQEYGEGSHQGFTFTCCHFGNFTFVQYHATEQLYVIVNHVPHRVVAAGVPMVLPDGFVTFDAGQSPWLLPMSGQSQWPSPLFLRFQRNAWPVHFTIEKATGNTSSSAFSYISNISFSILSI